jgi:hypothetical protein
MATKSFNLVLCPELDYCNYLHVNNPKSREKVLELIEERSLIDPYRQLYPDSFRYTWREKNPFRQARLDFFLFTESMLTNLKYCTIDPSYRSDHSMIISVHYHQFLEFYPYYRLMLHIVFFRSMIFSLTILL